MKRSQSSKHNSLRQAAASTPAVSSNTAILTTGSSSRANAGWGVFTVPTGVSVSNHRTNKVMDAAALRESDLDNMKKTDPFMYHSIRMAKAKASRPSLDLSRPHLTNGRHVQSPSNQVRRNTSDSVLLVKRQSRISCEKYHDISDMLEEIQALHASSRPGVSNPNEATIPEVEDELSDDEDDGFLSEIINNIESSA